MNVALMSKNQERQDLMNGYITQFMDDAYVSMDVQTFSDGTKLLQSLSERPVDILFYDFEGDEDFFNIIRRVVEQTATCQLVLVGDDNRNAVLGYALKAKDYLTYPIDEEDFIDTVARLVRVSEEQIQQVIPVRLGGQWSPLPVKHITHVESIGHYMTFHMDDGEEFKTLGKHQDFARNWQVNADFIRVHQSYVVNLNHVQDVDNKNITLGSGNEVPVSRTYLAQTKRALTLHRLHRYEVDPVKEKAPTKGGMQR